jgi:hypothetical protein
LERTLTAIAALPTPVPCARAIELRSDLLPAIQGCPRNPRADKDALAALEGCLAATAEEGFAQAQWRFEAEQRSCATSKHCALEERVRDVYLAGIAVLSEALRYGNDLEKVKRTLAPIFANVDSLKKTPLSPDELSQGLEIRRHIDPELRKDLVKRLGLPEQWIRESDASLDQILDRLKLAQRDQLLDALRTLTLVPSRRGGLEPFQDEGGVALDFVEIPEVGTCPGIQRFSGELQTILGLASSVSVVTTMPQPGLTRPVRDVPPSLKLGIAVNIQSDGERAHVTGRLSSPRHSAMGAQPEITASFACAENQRADQQHAAWEFVDKVSGGFSVVRTVVAGPAVLRQEGERITIRDDCDEEGFAEQIQSALIERANLVVTSQPQPGVVVLRLAREPGAWRATCRASLVIRGAVVMQAVVDVYDPDRRAEAARRIGELVGAHFIKPPPSRLTSLILSGMPYLVDDDPRNNRRGWAFAALDLGLLTTTATTVGLGLRERNRYAQGQSADLGAANTYLGVAVGAFAGVIVERVVTGLLYRPQW